MLSEKNEVCGSFGTGPGGRSRGLWCLLCVALVFAFGGVSNLDAQVLQASYPLEVDLADLTGTYGDVVLEGSVPPPPPSVGNPLCVNGVYGEQEAHTPSITSFDINDFQIDVEFMLTSLPASSAPVIMGGRLWRFIGLYVDSAGVVGLKYNNSNFSWSGTTVVAGTWYAGQIRYDGGTVQLYLDGTFVHDAVIGPLTNGGDTEFTVTDYSNGGVLNGCLRNLSISNDATVPVELQRFSVE